MRKLSDVMTREVVTLNPDDTVLDAARQMKQRDVGSMPVCDAERRVVGTLTDRDILMRVTAEGRDPGTTLVRGIMTTNVVCGKPGQDVDEATDLMERHKVRRLPVVDEENRLQGLFSIGTIARADPEDEATEFLKTVTEPPVK